MREIPFRAVSVVFAIALAAICTTTGKAFSLLGPYADWMVFTNGYQQEGDIGGPMDITEGYRWNVPIVTYGFEQSFLDFFGTNGVQAVESAIQVLNELPPSSGTVLTNYPLSPRRMNWAAESQNLLDLKFATVCALVEQMGLTQPNRYVFTLRRWSDQLIYGTDWWWHWAIPDYVLQRNFDPGSLLPSSYINSTLFTADPMSLPDGQHWMQTHVVDALADEFNTVASGLRYSAPYGAVLGSLTQDDVGGLRFLLSPTNVVFENLLPDVRGRGPNTGNYVNGAARGGVDKITFLRQPYDSLNGHFLPMTNQFTDSYFTNGIVLHQDVERVTTQPDFLFSAEDYPQIANSLVNAFVRTGTTNWVNNAVLNGQPSALGPGVIRPQVRIAFQRLGPVVYTQEESGPALTTTQYPSSWGSFDVSTNAPLVYPTESASGVLTTDVRLCIYNSGHERVATYFWSLPLRSGQTLALQTSTNLSDWSTCSVVTKLGVVTEWTHEGITHASRFFRVTAQ